jgi:hypothetical protein
MSCRSTFFLDGSVHYWNKPANHPGLFAIRQVLNKSFFEKSLDRTLAE